MSHIQTGQSTSPKDRNGDHGEWMMIAGYVPMIVVAVVLVATGVVGTLFLVLAIACLAAMAAMMTMLGIAGGSKQ